MVSQVLTLYTTPVIYLYMDRLQLMIAKRKTVRPVAGEAPPAPVKGVPLV
jgi:hypothetical protein